MISKPKSKYWQRTHTYGINIPKSVKEAYKFDEENGNKIRIYGIKEELNKVMLIPTTVIQPLHVQASITVSTRTGNIM